METHEAAKAKNSNSSASQEQARLKDCPKAYLSDIASMLEYYREQGIAVPTSLEDDVVSVHWSPVEAGPNAESFKNLLRVHGQLSGVIAPATPRSLVATKFGWRNVQSLRTYGLVWLLVAMAAAGLVGYMKTLPPDEKAGQVSQDSGTDKQRISEAAVPAVRDTRPVVMDSNDTEGRGGSKPKRMQPRMQPLSQVQFNYLFAAMIGAAFNGLLTAYRYLRNRSFDPHYVLVYEIRFAVGALAGVVLANLGSELFQDQTTLAKLGPGIIALLGGYSAEAVRQILDRLVVVLVTVVTGKEDAVGQERLSIAKDVLSIAEAAVNPQTPPAVKEKLDTLLKKLKG